MACHPSWLLIYSGISSDSYAIFLFDIIFLEISNNVSMHTHMSNISERSKSRPPPSSSSGLTKRAVVLTAVAAVEATPLPTSSVGVDGAKEVTPERKRVMVAMASFIVDWVGGYG